MQLRCTDRNGVRSGILPWNRYFFGRPENQDLLPSQRKVEGIVKSVLGCVKEFIESSSLLDRQRIVGWPQPPRRASAGETRRELTKPRPGVTVGLRSWPCVREKIEVKDVTRRDLAGTAGC